MTRQVTFQNLGLKINKPSNVENKLPPYPGSIPEYFSDSMHGMKAGNNGLTTHFVHVVCVMTSLCM